MDTAVVVAVATEVVVEDTEVVEVVTVEEVVGTAVVVVDLVVRTFQIKFLHCSCQCSRFWWIWFWTRRIWRWWIRRHVLTIT